MRLDVTPPEQANDVHRLLQHLASHVDRRPLGARHVLVQVLARADLPKESPRHHGRHRGCGVGHDRGMRPLDRARHACSDGEPLGRAGDASERGPHEWAVPLTVRPWMEVIRDQGEVEAGRLGPPRLADQVGRTELFAGELVTQVQHRVLA
jgi:hypothetical protein